MTGDAITGAVAIGRNEGARLIGCLESLREQVAHTVYVDSGSSDDSVATARSRGVHVVELDLDTPFTAARARNAGLVALLDLAAVDYVQFIDGDCELQEGWMGIALAFLGSTDDVAVAFGRRRERFPEVSVYNRLCDWEWDTPIGASDACGGDALMRVSALQQVGGYNPHLIAGEEPDLCVRLRGKGWRIWRLDHEMTLHDAAMIRFGQWWNRTRRAGHAFAEGAALHGAGPTRHWVSETRKALIWGIALPLTAVLAALVAGPWPLVVFVIYPMQAFRLAVREGGDRQAWERAFFLVAGKFAEALGVLQYWRERLSGRRGGLIEYK